MQTIEGSGQIVVEPDWPSLFSDELDVSAAREYWRVLTTELKDRDLLAPVNGHALQRLVCTYIVYDRASRQVHELGAVTKPRRGNSKAIPRISPYFTAMREAGTDAANIEADLGLSPRRRGAVTKVVKQTRAARASDNYLRPVAKG